MHANSAHVFFNNNLVYTIPPAAHAVKTRMRFKKRLNGIPSDRNELAEDEITIITIKPESRSGGTNLDFLLLFLYSAELITDGRAVLAIVAI